MVAASVPQNAAFSPSEWAVVLGGSSGFGLATARKLAAHGLSLVLVHRDRRSTVRTLEPVFEELRGQGVRLRTHNLDALDPEGRARVIDDLSREGGRVRVLLHSIAFGNLKLLVPEPPADAPALRELADELGIDAGKLSQAAERLLRAGRAELAGLAPPPAYPGRFLEAEDLARTVHAMGTSLVDWVQDLHRAGLFASDARVFGLTSEGNALAWKGYAAVSAAKAALEAVARSIATEFAPYGIRCNVLQPGVTDTPALRAIPGHERLAAHARLRNPQHRLTTPEDVAGVVYLLSQPEAAWINGEVIRVDGGEHVSGGGG